MRLVPIFLFIILVLTTINISCLILLFLYLKNQCHLISFHKTNNFKKKKYDDKENERSNQHLKKFILKLTQMEMEDN